jgi:ribosomal-protein-alanine N-acetyltransferase
VIEIRKLAPEFEKPLTRFFSILVEGGFDKWFHPHPFTGEEASRLANYSGADAYYIVMLDGNIIAYGMLRGWDEGYDVPSLGIAVAPLHQGKGIADILMRFLHLCAELNSAKQIRLTVKEDNARARRLYERLGYQFSPREDNFLVGFFVLSK